MLSEKERQKVGRGEKAVCGGAANAPGLVRSWKVDDEGKKDREKEKERGRREEKKVYLPEITFEG